MEEKIIEVVLLIIILAKEDIKAWWKHRKRGKLKDKISRDHYIRETLKTLVQKWDADRATVHILHNGQVFATGSHMNKFTMVHEYSLPHVASTRHLFQGVMIETYPALTYELIVKGTCSVANREELAPGPFQQMLALTTTQQAYYVAIQKNGKMVGFITLEFLTYRNIIEHDVLKVLQEKVGLIRDKI